MHSMHIDLVRFQCNKVIAGTFPRNTKYMYIYGAPKGTFS